MQNLNHLSGFKVVLDSGGVSSVITGGQASQETQAAPDGTTTTAADPNAAAVPVDPMGSIWLWVIYIPLLIGLYFLMTRPQRKREKQQKEMQAALRVGDEVVTAGGFFGRIADVGEDSFMIEFGRNRAVHIPVLKTDVVGVRSPKMTPPPKPAE